MSWFRKQVAAPSGEKINLEGVQTWMVYWTARHGRFHTDTVMKAQAFVSKEDAEHFAEQLRSAFALIGSRGNETAVEVKPT